MTTTLALAEDNHKTQFIVGGGHHSSSLMRVHEESHTRYNGGYTHGLSFSYDVAF